MIDNTVLLESPGCTGVRIGGGKVLTAQHCVEDKYEVGDVYTGFTVDYISPDHDFAVLSGDTPRPLMRLPDARVGEHVYVVGYPVSVDDGEQHLTVTDGIVAGPVHNDQQRITAYAYYGNSGGGCWNDAGELVGILVQIRPFEGGYDGYPAPMPAHSYIVPTKYIRPVL